MNKIKHNFSQKSLINGISNPLFLSVVIATTLTACGSGSSGGTTKSSLDKPPKPPVKTNQDQPVSKVKFSAVGETKFVTSPALVATRMWHDDKTKKVAPLSPYDKKEVLKVLEKTNEYRKAVGKKPLKWDEGLSAYAQMRSQELVEKNSHTRPDGTTANSGLIKKRGVIGENIASGQDSAEKVALGWKNSPSHYENIIDDNYDKIGIGFVRIPKDNSKTGFTYYWVQTFVGGGSKSPYEFDDTKKPKEPDVISLLGKNIKLLSKYDLKIIGGENIKTNASKAYSKGKLTHPIYKRSLRFKGNGFDAIVQDPTIGEFKYQTIAEIIDNRQNGYFPVQYVNIGQPTAPDNIENFKATYKGASIGNLVQDYHFYSDVVAKISGKKMSVVFSNTRLSVGKDKTVKRFDPNTAYGKALNFTEKLDWDKKKKQFIKTNSTSKTSVNFYGKNGDEIGGQFNRKIGNLGNYRGAFGAKKQ